MSALLLVALLVAADEPVAAPIQCRGGVCIMPESFVRAMIDAHNELVDECADVEITEPSKKYPMTPEPKPAVPFKLERNP